MTVGGVTSFSFTAAPVGVARLVVEGEDVTDRVEAFELRGGRREPTTLSLHIVGSGNVEGDALVSVAGPVDPSAVVHEFLSAISPQALDEAMARNPSMGRSVGESALAFLHEQAGRT